MQAPGLRARVWCQGPGAASAGSAEDDHGNDTGEALIGLLRQRNREAEEAVEGLSCLNLMGADEGRDSGQLWCSSSFCRFSSGGSWAPSPPWLRSSSPGESTCPVLRQNSDGPGRWLCKELPSPLPFRFVGQAVCENEMGPQPMHLQKMPHATQTDTHRASTGPQGKKHQQDKNPLSSPQQPALC